jgi:serine/threonine protein kinase
MTLKDAAATTDLLVCLVDMQKLLVYEPSQRISARAAMTHPWFEDLHPQYNSFRSNNCYNNNSQKTF